MSRYNEVYQCTWDSKDFKSLSKPKPNAQTLWLYLLTGRIRTPLPGIYNVGIGALVDFLKWSRESLLKCFRELSQKDMAKVDLENNVIYLPNWYKWNKPQNPNVLKSWLVLLENIPNCEYKYLYFQQLKSLTESLKEPFKDVLDNHFDNDMPNPEPEPEPKPGPKPEPTSKVEIPEHLKEIWPAFVEMRKKIKKPLTDKAVELTITNLEGLYPNNPIMQIKSIEQSIQRDYQGVFEVRNGAKNVKPYTDKFDKISTKLEDIQ